MRKLSQLSLDKEDDEFLVYEEETSNDRTQWIGTLQTYNHVLCEIVVIVV